MTDYAVVVDYLAKGDWEAAHDIVQADESALAAWAHGIVHLIEGDRPNAEYWFRRAKRDFPADVSINTEIDALRAEANTT